jgi:hypothetical protein
MAQFIKLRSLLVVFFLIVLLSPTYLHAGEAVKKAGVATGVTVGNLLFVPVKVALMVSAAPMAVISWLGSLGDTQQVKAIWKDTTDKPYFISPETARKAIGQRPDLTADWDPARDHGE